MDENHTVTETLTSILLSFMSLFTSLALECGRDADLSISHYMVLAQILAWIMGLFLRSQLGLWAFL